MLPNFNAFIFAMTNSIPEANMKTLKKASLLKKINVKKINYIYIYIYSTNQLNENK